MQVVATNGVTRSSRYTILTAQGGVTGAFANLTATSNLAFLSPVLSEDANDVFLGFAAKVTFPSVATTRNQIATANALQALGSGPVFNAVIGQSVAGARQAFDALSGEIHASTVTAAYEDALLPSAAILDRLNETVAAPVLGAATTTTGAYASDLPSGKGPRVAPVAVQLYQPRIFDVWGQGFGDWGRVSGDGNAASLSRSTGGFVLGGDVSASGVMGGDWRFGLAGGYTNDRISVSQRGSSANFESVFGGAYVGASFGALRCVPACSTPRTPPRRRARPPSRASRRRSPRATAARPRKPSARRVTVSSSRASALARTPASSPSRARPRSIIHQNGFTEEGGVSALTGVARDFDVQTTTLGVRGELAFATMPLTLKTMLGWRHAFGDVIPSTLLAFQGGAQGFRVAGVPIDRNAFVAEVGIDYAVTSMLSVGVSYSGQYGQRAMDNAVKAHLNLSF